MKAPVKAITMVGFMLKIPTMVYVIKVIAE
jgi:hypothetical protein